MKQITCYIFALLIVLILAGCGEKTPLQESNANSAAISSRTTAPETNSTPNQVVLADQIMAEIDTAFPETPTQPNPRDFDVNDIKMQSTPESTCFSEVGYDSDWEVLVVQFRDSGSVYTYSDFAQGEWNEFIAADSLGSWYNTYIKGQYECERIS